MDFTYSQKTKIIGAMKLLKNYYAFHAKDNDYDQAFTKIAEAEIEDCDEVIKIVEEELNKFYPTKMTSSGLF